MTDDPVGVLHLRAVARRWVRRLSVRASSFIGPRLSQQGTVRPEGVEHQWRKVPPRELSVDLVADGRGGRVRTPSGPEALRPQGSWPRSNGAFSYLGLGTRETLLPDMFLTVPPIPAFRSASRAFVMSFKGTCRTFFALPLILSRRAAAFTLPLRSTSIAVSFLAELLATAERNLLLAGLASGFRLRPFVSFAFRHWSSPERMI